ncbi:MAG: hypothetical protein IT410_01160 [Candidatus Doudnabacteria bacterium]|nr:hypothetical protein [Candidatus Doudnabacteria bacterium]
MANDKDYLRDVGQTWAGLQTEFRERSALLEETVEKMRTFMKNEGKKISSISTRSSTPRSDMNKIHTPG